jgi:predicted Fe-S protein YdhL (DUF1289 family)
MAVNSPCINICQIDVKTQWCIGCGRTIEEITLWQAMSPQQQQNIIDQLKPRIAQIYSEQSITEIKHDNQYPKRT